MPELPEVETVRRLMESILVDRTLAEVEVVEDAIVYANRPPKVIHEALQGRTVRNVGRKGKYWWLQFDQSPVLVGHLGMAGWIYEKGNVGVTLMEHGNAPREDEKGRPRFLKLLLTTQEGRSIALTDGRRLARVRLADHPEDDSGIAALGPDALDELPSPHQLHEMLVKRRAPIKAVLLDQSTLAGIGNYLADEILFQSGIAPKRTGDTLSAEESEKIHGAIQKILPIAIQAGADYQHFPEDWLFHARWGGKKGTGVHLGETVIREQVGGRTTAWIPSRQY